jgi:hypothetical protein
VANEELRYWYGASGCIGGTRRRSTAPRVPSARLRVAGNRRGALRPGSNSGSPDSEADLANDRGGEAVRDCTYVLHCVPSRPPTTDG